MHRFHLIFSLTCLLLVFLGCRNESAQPPSASGVPGYLAFQIFTGTATSDDLVRSFPLDTSIRARVGEIVAKIGTVGDVNHRLGFIVGPITLDNSEGEVRTLIRQSFQVALEKNVAVGFHLDDFKFWKRLSVLNTPENIEWINWQGRPGTGLKLAWSSTPLKISPMLCLNSAAVKARVAQLAQVIGDETKRGVATLAAANKAYLFIGVIAGWETQMGNDYDTDSSMGYHALANKGFSSVNLPPSKDAAIEQVVKDYIGLWVQSLQSGGVPPNKIYSHIAFISVLQYTQMQLNLQGPLVKSYSSAVNYSPPSVAFVPGVIPGFSTYPAAGFLEDLTTELQRQAVTGWASCEGTALDPSQADRPDAGMNMEIYLGNLFNRGAVLVNVFGWGVGDAQNPFRRVAENANAIAAYQKYLRGEKLTDTPLNPQQPSQSFATKIKSLQQKLPPYMQRYQSSQMAQWYQQLTGLLQTSQFQDAEKIVDLMLAEIARAR